MSPTNNPPKPAKGSKPATPKSAIDKSDYSSKPVSAAKWKERSADILAAKSAGAAKAAKAAEAAKPDPKKKTR